MASEINSVFYSVSSSDLVSSWVGESEKYVQHMLLFGWMQCSPKPLNSREWPRQNFSLQCFLVFFCLFVFCKAYQGAIPKCKRPTGSISKYKTCFVARESVQGICFYTCATFFILFKPMESQSWRREFSDFLLASFLTESYLRTEVNQRLFFKRSLNLIKKKLRPI